MQKSKVALATLLLATVAGQAVAQSREALTYIGATNRPNSLPSIDSSRTEGTEPSTTSVQRSFTGLNSAGEQQTMTLDAAAFAQSDYGRLRASVGGSLTNAYQNDSNAPFFDGTTVNEAGSPDSFGVLANPEFTDTVTAVGNVRAGYRNRYTFFVDGVVTGGSIASFIQFKAGSNPREFLSVDTSAGRIAQTLTTQAYEVTPTFTQDFEVLFSVQFNPSTFGEPALVEGSGDFTSTITLVGIGLYDENDNLVSGYSYESASGTTYNPVPEPASMTVLGLGVVGLLRRRAKR